MLKISNKPKKITIKQTTNHKQKSNNINKNKNKTKREQKKRETVVKGKAVVDFFGHIRDNALTENMRDFISDLEISFLTMS